MVGALWRLAALALPPAPQEEKEACEEGKEGKPADDATRNGADGGVLRGYDRRGRGFSWCGRR
jgi:hypothetical protein